MIPFIAKAMIPAILIFLPIYCGLKINRHFKNKEKREAETAHQYDEFV